MPHRRSNMRLGRVLALEVLYRWDLLNNDYEEIISDVIRRENPNQRVIEFLIQLIHAFFQHKERVDELIRRNSRNWKLERMHIIDRSILRLAVAELIAIPDVDENIVINEAVELAKTYSTDEARAFINGVLDSIVKELKSQSRDDGSASENN